MPDISSIAVGGKNNTIKDAEARRLLQVLDRLYNGVDLTKKFAAEITGYASPWDWIKARIQAANYTDIHVGDDIPFALSDGKTFKAEIAGIDTYYRGDEADKRIGHHIDFITRDCHPDARRWNKANYNNGLNGTPNPWLCSDIYAWLNGLSMVVPNATTADPATIAVNYTASGVLPLMPVALRNNIVQKRALIPERYTAGTLLTDSNSFSWQSMGKLWLPSEVEVCGCNIWGTTQSPLQGYDSGGFAQYPIFTANTKRVKGDGDGGGNVNWWFSSVQGGHSTDVAYAGHTGGVGTYVAAGPNFHVPLCFRIA